MGAINFTIRWREELEAESHLGILVLEYNMGQAHVYFPDEMLWVNSVPEWAKSLWHEYRVQCAAWCASRGVPFSITENTFVYEERKK